MRYLNHAACGPLADATVETVQEYLRQEQALGAYGAARAAQPAIDGVYERIAALVGTTGDTIALTQGNSDGWARIVTAMRWQAGDRVLVARTEWGGNLGVLSQLASRYGIRVEEIPSDAAGHIDLDALAGLLATPARLVTLTWVPANGPLIQPAEAVGALCAQAGVPLLVDAAQAVGQIPVDVRRLQCAALTAPGRKWLRGPRGTGFFYVHPAFLAQLEPAITDHLSRPWREGRWAYRADTRRLEMSEASIALRLGLGAAIAQWQALGIDNVRQAIDARARWLRHALSQQPGVVVHETTGSAMSGIVTFVAAGRDASLLHHDLQRRGIECALSPAAFTPLDMQARGLPGVLRLSPGHDTAWEDLHHCVEAVDGALAG